MNEVFAKRFKELQDKFKGIHPQSHTHSTGRYYPSGVWKNWATSSQSLIKAVYGENAPHYTNFMSEFNSCDGSEYSVNALFGIFMSAKEDFEGGYVFNPDLKISGEVLGDFLSLAKHALSEGHKDVAAVLACAALEDALKRYATAKELDIEGNTMQEVVNALKGAGLVSGAQKSLLDPMPKIRNMALHADWDKLNDPDINSVIGYTEQFLLSNLS